MQRPVYCDAVADTKGLIWRQGALAFTPRRTPWQERQRFLGRRRSLHTSLRAILRVSLSDEWERLEEFCHGLDAAAVAQWMSFLAGPSKAIRDSGVMA